jgi:hypothetical protein
MNLAVFERMEVKAILNIFAGGLASFEQDVKATSGHGSAEGGE